MQLSTDTLKNNFTQSLATQNATAQNQTATASSLQGQTQALTTQYNAGGVDYTSCVTYAIQEAQEFFLEYTPAIIQACFLSNFNSFFYIINEIQSDISNYQAQITNLIGAASGCYNPVCAVAIGASIAALILELELYLASILIGLIFQLGFLLADLLICYPAALGAVYLTAYNEFFECLLLY